MTAPLTARYELDQATFMAACHALWAHRAVGRWGNFAVAGLLAALSVFWLALGGAGALIWVLLAVAVLVSGMTLMRDAFWRRHFRTHPKFSGPAEVTLHDAGLDFRNPEASGQVGWAQYNGVLITDQAAILVVSDRVFSVIPLSGFDDPRRAVDLMHRKLRKLPRRFI